MEVVSAFTWPTTPVTCWFNPDVCWAIWLEAELKSAARVVAALMTPWRTEASDGLASSEPSEPKKELMSVPRVVDIAEVELAVMPKMDCRLVSAVLSAELEDS